MRVALGQACRQYVIFGDSGTHPDTAPLSRVLGCLRNRMKPSANRSPRHSHPRCPAYPYTVHTTKNVKQVKPFLVAGPTIIARPLLHRSLSTDPPIKRRSAHHRAVCIVRLFYTCIDSTWPLLADSHRHGTTCPSGRRIPPWTHPCVDGKHATRRQRPSLIFVNAPCAIPVTQCLPRSSPSRSPLPPHPPFSSPPFHYPSPRPHSSPSPPTSLPRGNKSAVTFPLKGGRFFQNPPLVDEGVAGPKPLPQRKCIMVLGRQPQNTTHPFILQNDATQGVPLPSLFIRD